MAKQMIAVGRNKVVTAVCTVCKRPFDVVNETAMKLYDAGKLHCRQCTAGKNIIWSRNSYADYLKTDYWQERRQRALKKSLFACQICKEVERLEVHHNAYDRIGSELDSDLIVLCGECHSLFHGRMAGLNY